MALIDQTFYDAVRFAIDANFGVDDLPDALIRLDIYSGEGQRLVTRKVADWALRTGDDLRQLQSSAVLYTAALIVEAAPNLLTEMVGHRGYAYTREPRDPATMARRLRARAAALVSRTLALSLPPAPVLAIARGGR